MTGSLSVTHGKSFDEILILFRTILNIVFYNLKTINPYDKDSRHQMLNDLKVLLTDYKCENLIQCYGAYYEDG